MAKMSFSAEFSKALTQTFDELQYTETQIVSALKEANEAVVRHVRIESILQKVPEGQVVRSLKAQKPKRNSKGVWEAKATFTGDYDPKLKKPGSRGGKNEKKRNAEVAFLINYGQPTRGVAPKPFVSEGVTAAADEVTQIIAEKLGGK